MLQITALTVEGKRADCVTDCRAPRFSAALASDRRNVQIVGSRIRVADENTIVWDSGVLSDGRTQYIRYEGAPLSPFTRYTVTADFTDDAGETACGQTVFETGRYGMPWRAKWIACGSQKPVLRGSPVPLVFRRELQTARRVRFVRVYATAWGVFEVTLNGQKLGRDCLAPGFTSYRHYLQYCTYDATALWREKNELRVVVSGGWAVGAFTFQKKNRLYADRPMLLCELRIVYQDGSVETVGSDEDWLVSTQGALREASIYDGEIFDARIDERAIPFERAAAAAPRETPRMIAVYGELPARCEELLPVSCTRAKSGEWVYDFGQNFAGVIDAVLTGRDGQRLVFRHAEVLADGELFTKPLRSAKARVVYTCRDGEQHYTPRHTYMGFRYVGVTGIEPQNLKLTAFALHSTPAEIGAFECSHAGINRLQQNIVWSGRSNFVDIPTDCPQRDERMGWTGDLAVFAATACYNFDMRRFLEKWLLDMRAEQGRGGGIPVVVPDVGCTGPTFATAGWGDSSVLVPWAMYLAYGDTELLQRQYPTIRRFLAAAKFWAGLLSVGQRKYIWRLPFHYGDWCAPGEKQPQWIAKGPWVATAYYANSCGIAAKIAALLGKHEDERYYLRERQNAADAYRRVFTDGKGRLKKEFQTAYVCPLYFGLPADGEREAMAANLARLVREAGNHLTTGFLGTPYLLFALSDNGYVSLAYEVLLQEDCPSWLYEVKAGGTSVWERWDALRPDGTVNLTGALGDSGTGSMVSFNHYANGAVGDWLYRRILGIEPLTGGYKSFAVKPLPGGGITYAKGHIDTGYGRIAVAWHIENDRFSMELEVPVHTSCLCTLPDGSTRTLGSGKYQF